MYIGNCTGPTYADVIGQIPLNKLASSEEDVKLDQAFDQGDLGVKPVGIDEKGSPFLEFEGADGRPFRQYINSPMLSGELAVETSEGISVAEQVALHQWRLKISPPT